MCKYKKNPRQLQIKSVVPETAALLETQQVGKSRRIGLDAETVRLPGAGRNPGNGDVEAMHIVGGTDLSRCKLLCLEIVSGRCIDIHLGRQLDIAVESKCLRNVVLDGQGIEFVVVRPAAVTAEGVAEINRPRYIGVGIIQPAPGNVFPGIRMGIDTSVVAGVEKTMSGRWRARITVNRIGIQIGTYDTIEEAQAARQEAERKYYGEFAPNGRNVASRTPETRVTLWEVKA